MGIKKISGESEIEELCKEAIKENPQAVKDYKKGEEKAMQFLIGKVMQKTKGQADPKVLNEIIGKLLK